MQNKQSYPKKLHPRNKHQGRYPFNKLIELTPSLKPFIKINPSGEQTIDFSDSNAVIALNRALLAYYYQIQFWQIPNGYLCPPIPGRADYLHYLADLLSIHYPNNKIPTGKLVKVLDIGTGANCIYPIIGEQIYQWQFTATEIDPVSVSAAKTIIKANKLNTKVKQQTNRNAIFNGIIGDERYCLTLSNPPFYASLSQAEQANQKKRMNLSKHKAKQATRTANSNNDSSSTLKTASVRNFGGQKAELWCEGGEIAFLRQMVKESLEFAPQVCWFTSLVSNKNNLRPLKLLLTQLGARQIKIIPMSQGQKVSRILAWSFLTAEQQADFMQSIL